jgi:hypothetical protein
MTPGEVTLLRLLDTVDGAEFDRPGFAATMLVLLAPRSAPPRSVRPRQGHGGGYCRRQLLAKRRHRGLACRLIAVRRGAAFR